MGIPASPRGADISTTPDPALPKLRQFLDGGELFVLSDVGVGVQRQADVAVPGQRLSDFRRNAASR